MNDLSVSDTGRRVRSDSIEGRYGAEFVRSLVLEFYVNRKLSSTEAVECIEKEYGIKMSADKLLQLAKRLGVTRGKSEATSLSRRTISYDPIMTDDIRDIVDGILMGDGNISVNVNTGVGRLRLDSAHKEFAQYCSDLLRPYDASIPSFSPARKGKGNGMWYTQTRFHPDFFEQYERWYYNDGKKDIPQDIRFTKMFLLLWYLGDGSISAPNDMNSRSLYFSTNSFSRRCLDEIVVPKFEEIGIDVRGISKDNRTSIASKSIYRLLQVMGGESPVKCFCYKFDLEEWRTWKPMKQVAKELYISYQKLSHWVKIGKVNHNRSPGGKKVMFTQDQFDMLRIRIDSGELPRQKGKKARSPSNVGSVNTSLSALNDLTSGRIKSTSFFDRALNSNQVDELSGLLRGAEMRPTPGESEQSFLDRVVRTYQRAGFPFPFVSDARKTKLWHSLKKSMCYPLGNCIRWNKSGIKLANSFHLHKYSLHAKGKLSPQQVFQSYDAFYEAIRAYRDAGGRLTYGGVLAALSNFGGGRKVGNFSPFVVKDILGHYGFDGMRVVDPCAGFSGRLIGASTCRYQCVYTGIELSKETLKGLLETQRFLFDVAPDFQSTIVPGAAQKAFGSFSDGSFDLCFTSPPYFDLEIYGEESSQSLATYPNYDFWLKSFLGTIVGEVYRVLSVGGRMVLNVGGLSSYSLETDTIHLAEAVGFTLERIHQIQFGTLPYSDTNILEEPLLVFQK